MSRQASMRALFAVLGCAALVSGGQALPAEKHWEPEPGEIGKDVMWLPSDDVMVRRMLDLASVGARDFVVDLGSGDGRTVIAAARRGARALGVEHNPQLVEYSRRIAQDARVGDRASFVQGDLFEADLSRATVITLFLLDDINLKLRPKLLGLRAGTRIVSNTFDMAEWRPDSSAKVAARDRCTAYCNVYLWIVPAKLGGAWRIGAGELTIEQSFQMIAGTLRVGGKAIAIKGRVNGDRVSFTAGDALYTGRAIGSSIKGTVKSGSGSTGWIATRPGKAGSRDASPVPMFVFQWRHGRGSLKNWMGSLDRGQSSVVSRQFLGLQVVDSAQAICDFSLTPCGHCDWRLASGV